VAGVDVSSAAVVGVLAENREALQTEAVGVETGDGGLTLSAEKASLEVGGVVVSVE